jgi:dTDP-4-amino-4,6-dideoxygalactose transaminase
MEWKVRYIDYPQQYQKMRDEILQTVDTVLTRGDVMLRQQLRDFEENLAAFVGTRYAVGTSNCTDALHLTLRAAGIGTGDEVITVSHTFVATAAAIHHAGAVPVLIDIGDDHNLDVELIEPAITPRTRAIMPVHLNGRLCDMGKLMTIAEKHNLLVIEDTAQALGGAFNGIKGGAWALGGCFSFYPAKLLGAYGDAGALVTNSEEIAERVRSLRDHGRLPSGDLAGWSFNCRLDNLHAAILDLKLKQVPAWIARRRALASIYQQHLSDVPELLLPPSPADDSSHFDVFQNYEIEAEERDELKSRLQEKGIETLIPWGGKGVHQFPSLGLGQIHLPRTERMFDRALMLPLHCELTDEQVVYVSDMVKEFYCERPEITDPVTLRLRTEEHLPA